FFQAEDGIRDFHVTGVQTCALPISRARRLAPAQEPGQLLHVVAQQVVPHPLLPRRLELHPVGHGLPGQKFFCSGRRESRSWNRALVTSRRSSIGLSTRSLAPSRSSSAWLSGLASPVITSTGRSRLP